jgi:NADH-quinone oxidoreductase subunit M
MYKRVIFGPVANAHVAALKDIGARESLVLALLALAVLGMGLYPQPMNAMLSSSVADLLALAAQTKL